MDSMDVSQSDNNDTDTKNQAPKTNASIKESHFNYCYFNSRNNDNHRAINKISEESKTKDQTNGIIDSDNVVNDDSAKDCDVDYKAT